MTSSEIPSRIAFKTPFAITGDKTAIADSDGANVNMQTGFPSVYSVPAANGGKYVARGDMNALLNLSTNDLFYHKCGGLNTFDAEFAVKIGGYPKNAILKYIDGTDIYDVISLVDDNKIDFTGTMPTSSQQTGGILLEVSTVCIGRAAMSSTRQGRGLRSFRSIICPSDSTLSQPVVSELPQLRHGLSACSSQPKTAL